MDIKKKKLFYSKSNKPYRKPSIRNRLKKLTNNRMNKHSAEIDDKKGNKTVNSSSICCSAVYQQKDLLPTHKNDDVSEKSNVSILFSSMLNDSCNDNEENSECLNENSNDEGKNENSEVTEAIVVDGCDENDQNDNENIIGNDNASKETPTKNINKISQASILLNNQQWDDTMTSIKSTAISAAAIVLSSFVPLTFWSPHVIDHIITIGEKLYTESLINGNKNSKIELKEKFLKPSELLKTVEIADKCTVVYEKIIEIFGENILLFICGDHYLSFSKSILNICCKEQAAILSINRRSIAIFSRFGKYYLFDAEGRNGNGITCFPRLNVFIHISNLVEWITSNYYAHSESTNSEINNSYSLTIIRTKKFLVNGYPCSMNSLKTVNALKKNFSLHYLLPEDSKEIGERINYSEEQNNLSSLLTTNKDLPSEPSNVTLNGKNNDSKNIYKKDENKAIRPNIMISGKEEKDSGMRDDVVKNEDLFTNEENGVVNSGHEKTSTNFQSDILEKIKPYDIIRASINQSDDKFKNSAGKQCTAMAASAIAMASFLPIEAWESQNIDDILDIGNNLYEISMLMRRYAPVEDGPNDQYYLEGSELHTEITIDFSCTCKFKIVNTFYGKCFNISDLDFQPLQKRLDMFVGKNIGAILTMNNLSVSIISYEGFYYLFDSHSRDEKGRKNDSNGKSCICCFDDIEQLYLMVLNNMYIINENDVNNIENMRTNAYVLSTIEVTAFHVTGKEYKMSDCVPGQPFKIYASFMSNKNSEAMKQSSNKNSLNKESSSLNNKRPSCSSDNQEKSKKKKIRKPKRLRSELVSDKHPKQIVNMKYVQNEVNTLFFEHRINSFDKCCRGLECQPIFIGPIMNGLQSTLLYECSACGYEFTVLSEPEGNNIAKTNDSIVLGCISIGIGFYQLESLLTAADLPCYNYNSYSIAELVVGEYIIKASLKSMFDVAEESVNRARNEGRITKDGIAFTTVITDGTYPKRTYASGLYNSSSGATVVIDKFINKVLDVGVANKRCSQCQFGNQDYHLCWLNFNANISSTQMESAIIFELFQTSVSKYKLIYKTLISDGDSSVHQLIIDHNVYATHDVIVDRVNCVNHLLRRLSTNLQNILKLSQLKKQVNLKQVITEAGQRSAKAIRAAARHLNSTKDSHQIKIIRMREDLENIPFHAFGQHKNCNQYYCDNKPETNNVETMVRLNIWNIVYGYYSRCISVPEDVLMNASNNPAECINNVIASKIGGKRTDPCKLGGYNIRVAFAVIQFNSKAAVSNIYAAWGKDIPERILALEEKRKKKVEYNNRQYHEKGYRSRYCKNKYDGPDCYYGPSAGIAISPKQYDSLLNNHKERLAQLMDQRVQIERDTVDQVKSEKWHITRRLLLTASNFKDVCKSQIDKTKNDVVRKILYQSHNNMHPAMLYGRNNESNALDRLEEHLKILIEPCGLFIDDTIPGLGASPDGLIGQEGIVEIKCPYTLKDTEPLEAIKKGCSWSKEHFESNDPLKLKTSSRYYYQIQGQLHITKRKWCILSIWTPKASHNLNILYNKNFWETKMLPRLTEFYWKYLVPELLNPKLLYKTKNSDVSNEKPQEPPKVYEKINDPLQQFFYGKKKLEQWFSLTPIVRLRTKKQVINDNNNNNDSSNGVSVVNNDNGNTRVNDKDVNFYTNVDNDNDDDNNNDSDDDYDFSNLFDDYDCGESLSFDELVNDFFDNINDDDDE